MRKKLAMMAVALLVSLAGHAQFEKGKVYCGASLTGLNLSYNGSEECKLGIMGKGGYLVADDFMLTAQVAYNKQHSVAGVFSAGVGARYYIVQNGLFLGAGVDFRHDGNAHDDFMPTVQVGYAFFMSRTVTVEPEIYYNQSFKNHGDFSTVGFRVGVGVYL